jgi:hypothetical protein
MVAFINVKTAGMYTKYTQNTNLVAGIFSPTMPPKYALPSYAMPTSPISFSMFT